MSERLSWATDVVMKHWEDNEPVDVAVVWNMVPDLVAERDQLRADLQVAHDLGNKANVIIDQLRAELVNERNIICALQMNVDMLRAELAEAIASESRAVTKLQATYDQLAAVKAERDHWEAEVKERYSQGGCIVGAVTARASKDAEVLSEIKRDALEKQLAAARAELADAIRDNDAIRHERADVRFHWKNAAAEVERLTVAYESKGAQCNAALDEVERLKEALEEREDDMHNRIRLGYDKTVADTWRAANDALRTLVRELADALDDSVYDFYRRPEAVIRDLIARAKAALGDNGGRS